MPDNNGVQYTNPPQSRNEAIVEAIIEGTEYTDPPQSENEEILVSILNETPYEKPPTSRMSDLLLKVKDFISEGGGGKVFRDKVIIPDIYNTGCKGNLTKFVAEQDTSGLAWINSSGGVYLDFNNGKALKNTGTTKTFVFENLDFTNYSSVAIQNASLYSTTSAYYKDDVKFIFKNCLFIGVDANYSFSENVKIIFEFINCKMLYCKGSNQILKNCIIGNTSYYQENCDTYLNRDAITPLNRNWYINCYIMDLEAKLDAQGSGHIDGLQITGDVTELHMYNCRFECIDMPYEYSQGGWSYSIFWQHIATESSMEYCTIQGGGLYQTAITKAENQLVQNNFISEDYDTPCYPSSNYYQMDDDWASYIESLLVGSVWVENGYINICVSNDLKEARTLTIVADTEDEYTFTIPKCPTHDELMAGTSGVTAWSDLPFDIVKQIPAAGVKNIKCYDGETLIRTHQIENIGPPYEATESAEE